MGDGGQASECRRSVPSRQRAQQWALWSGWPLRLWRALAKSPLSLLRTLHSPGLIAEAADRRCHSGIPSRAGASAGARQLPPRAGRREPALSRGCAPHLPARRPSASGRGVPEGGGAAARGHVLGRSYRRGASTHICETRSVGCGGAVSPLSAITTQSPR